MGQITLPVLATHERCCHGKVRFDTRKHARRVAKRMGKPGLNAYRCTHCGWWHIGHADAWFKHLVRLQQACEG